MAWHGEAMEPRDGARGNKRGYGTAALSPLPHRVPGSLGALRGAEGVQGGMGNLGVHLGVGGHRGAGTELGCRGHWSASGRAARGTGVNWEALGCVGGDWGDAGSVGVYGGGSTGMHRVHCRGEPGALGLTGKNGGVVECTECVVGGTGHPRVHWDRLGRVVGSTGTHWSEL